MQFDADTVGSASTAADAEICMMAADTMEALGIQRGQYVVKVNNRKVLDGVLEAIGLGGERTRASGSRCCARSTSSIVLALTACRELAWRGSQGRERRFHQGRGLDDIESSVSICHGSTRRMKASGRSTRTRRDDRSTLGSALTDTLRQSEGSRRDCGRSLNLRCAAGYSDRIELHRSLRRPRPRILHRPGLRSRTPARDQGRERPPGALRLGRRRRAL